MGQAQAQRQRQPIVSHRQRVQQCAIQSATSQLRRAYFAQAGVAVARYGIMFEQAVKHVTPMWESAPRYIKDIRYADDLVQAVACVNRAGVAWTDLVEQHERILIRASRDRFEEVDAILIVRKMFVDIKRCTESDSCDSKLSLRNYYGTSSLRGWLCKCLAQAMTEFAYGKPIINERPMRFCEHCSQTLSWDAIESKLPNTRPAVHSTPQIAVGSDIPAQSSTQQ